MPRNTLINRAAVRRHALDCADKMRYHTFDRVSEEWLDSIESDLKLRIAKQVTNLPSKGKTIKP
jgi:hypothetical protein